MKGVRIALAVAAVAVMTLAGARPAYAWDELGHRVVARIAWDNMTPAARAGAVRLLMAAPPGSGIAELLPRDGRTLEERQRDWFVAAAVWPDQIRDRDHPGNRYAHSDWHYVNFFWEQRPNGTRVDRPDVPRAGELLNQLARISRTLGDAGVPDSAKAVDLAWALHLAGDAHQPLHNSARITAANPEGDRGGNLFRLGETYPSNLHSYWDGLTGPSFPWRMGDRDEWAYVGRIAATIEERHPRRAVENQLLPGQFETWSREGLRVAQNAAYPGAREGERPSRRYRRVAWEAAEPRIALAGYRLADLLNRTLGS